MFFQITPDKTTAQLFNFIEHFRRWFIPLCQFLVFGYCALTVLVLELNDLPGQETGNLSQGNDVYGISDWFVYIAVYSCEDVII